MVKSEFSDSRLLFVIGYVQVYQESGRGPVSLLVLVEVQADLSAHREGQALVSGVGDDGLQSEDALRQLHGDTRLGI